MSSAPVSWRQPKVWPPCCRAHFSSYFADKHGANHMIFIIHIYIYTKFAGIRYWAFVYLFTSFAVLCSRHLTNGTLLTFMRLLWYGDTNDERRDIAVDICNCRRQRTHLPWFLCLLCSHYFGERWRLRGVLFDFGKSQVQVVYIYIRKRLANLWDKINVSQRLSFTLFFFSLFMRRGNKVFPRLANWNNNVVVLMFDVWTVLETTPFFIEINTGCRQIWLGASVVVL